LEGFFTSAFLLNGCIVRIFFILFSWYIGEKSVLDSGGTRSEEVCTLI